MTLLQLLMSSRRLEMFLLQCFNLALSALNLDDMFLALSLSPGVDDQQSITVSRKSLCSTQKFSKRKTFAFGMLVLITTLHGMWSEVILAKGITAVLGKSMVQFVDVKNQSSFSRSGSVCMLLHVKARPFSGSSTRPKCPMASVKVRVSATFPPGLLRLLSDL